MIVKVFLLGRPGSGKTTAFQYVKMRAYDKGLNVTRFREYTILHNMFRTGRKEFQASDHGAFDILDFSVLNESAQHLQEQIEKRIRFSNSASELYFIELARGDYRQAMRCFSSDFLQNAYFLFFDASVETCIQRIHHRVAYPVGTDGHFVSENILRSYYSRENKDYMTSHFKADHNIQKEVVVIENTGTLFEFEKKLDELVPTLFKSVSQKVPAKA